MGTIGNDPQGARKKTQKNAHPVLFGPTSPATRSPDPPLPPADFKNEDVQLSVVTNAKSEKMSASDIDGHGNDDEDDGKEGEHENQSLQGSVL